MAARKKTRGAAADPTRPARHAAGARAPGPRGAGGRLKRPPAKDALQTCERFIIHLFMLLTLLLTLYELLASHLRHMLRG